MECYDHFFDRAMKAADAGKHVLARDLLQEYVQFEPNEPRGWLQLAVQFRELREWVNAREAAERALVLIERKDIVHRLIGTCFEEEGRWKEAIDAYQRALAEKPTPVTLVFLGHAYTELHRDAEAIDAYKAALELDPGYEEAHYNLGCRYKLAREYDKALAHFRRAIELDPEYGIAYAQLGEVMCRPPFNHEAAKPILEKAVKLVPDDFWARIYLGFVYYFLDDKAAASKQYQEAIRIAPAEAIAHDHLGDTLACIGKDPKRAKFHLKEAVRLDPECAFALRDLGRWHLRWGRVYDGEKYLLRAKTLGDKWAARLLNSRRKIDRAPKVQRRPICRRCGEPMTTQRKMWWCVGCGTDLRAPKERRKHDPENPNFSKPRK